ncbi:hypothetical protein LKL35_36780 [Streptomyces sp. ET3-23]|uniref:hypothetical protein n=1 Tax=Streptomyces sp. ET3-23 TaxID=2885643 RepID=UPI001D10DDEA|nr:hypothetical protein [Streptomyces sp. ET3-23]MCC2280882.1 hypothetical protein [Streptomyces sp. ET3-23]
MSDVKAWNITHTGCRQLPARWALSGCAALTIVWVGLPAQAASVPLSPAELELARQAADAPATHDTLRRFFDQDRSSTAGGSPRLAGPTVPVHSLNPEFVAGKDNAAVAKLEYAATTAVAPDGRTASIWTTRQEGTWRVVNIASGDHERRYAAKAQGQDILFREPQINAWYVLRDGHVEALDSTAECALGAKGISLAAYRAHVRSRYADKLPGSAYAADSVGGGYPVDGADLSMPPRTLGSRGAVLWPAVATAALVILSGIWARTSPRSRTSRMSR